MLASFVRFIRLVRFVKFVRLFIFERLVRFLYLCDFEFGAIGSQLVLFLTRALSSNSRREQS